MNAAPTSALRHVLRPLWAAAIIAAWSAPAQAQGPSQLTDPVDPAAVEIRAKSEADAAELLKSNAARLLAADAARPVAVDRSKPFASWSASVFDFRDSILVSVARTQVGTRYLRGGQSPTGGFDCSGLVRYVMHALQVPMPRTAAEQARTGLALGRDTTRLRPGDLLTFGKSNRGVSHIGIYVGNGRYIHASSVAGQVIESEINRTAAPRIRPWRGTRRVVLTDADSALKSDG